MKVGVVGCGNISPVYLRVARQFPEIEILAVADAIPERAQERASQFGVPLVLSVEELIQHPEIEIVLNLTPPQAHAPLNKAALQAGKHVYCEKPFGIHRAEAREVLTLAEQRGLYIGCAPDTVLGAGIQTCLKLIRDGAIGEPVGASAFMLSAGHEHWHPNPEFFYQPGGGPMLDMGPYYITTLITLLGTVRRVAGMSRITRPTRVIRSEPKRGQVVSVQTPTHITGAMEFTNGAIATVTMSFDVWAHRLPCIEVYGTEGTLGVPDPNGFGGPVLLRTAGESEWREVALTHPYAEQYRSLGLAEMIRALQEGRPNRLNGQLAYHALDVMLAFNDSSVSGQHILLESTCTPPEPMPQAGL
ncbi:MAG: Gfo/Idh/MocA family oxidoreductase [Fimbriimonadales bacterium]|nr:Gfo/Idh/MocA family oxidoreductase [Fimbriimonadales bacterium]